MNDYKPNELMHHGVPGMRWGHRKGSNTSSSKTRIASISKKNAIDSNTKVSTLKKKVKKSKIEVKKPMTDTELKQKIERLELERKYSELVAKQSPQKSTRMKAFVSGVLEQSAKNIATQATAYALGTMVNKMVGTEVVNPKKGQKDK